MLLGELHPCGGGDVIPLTQDKLLVGRRSHCDICLKYHNVSSHHCELEFKNGFWHIRDLGSSNGTKVNGMRIDHKSLMPGDEVMFAKHGFNIDYVVTTDAAAPEEENPFAMSLMEKAGLEVERSRRTPGAASNRSDSTGTRRNSAKDEFLMEWLTDDE